MMLFEVLITDMVFICGANENENMRLGRVRLGQCGQIEKKTEWGSKLKRGKLYILQKSNLHLQKSFLASKSLTM